MTDTFIKVMNMSITASYVALIVVFVRMILNKTPKSFAYALWSVVLFRLLSPVSFKSSLSLLRLLNSKREYIPMDIGIMQIPEVSTNIEVIDNVINNSLPAATPIESVNPMQIQMSILAIVWIIGIVVLIIYSIYSYMKISNRVQYATLVGDNIFETDQIRTPFVLGLIKPRIYLPVGLLKYEQDYIVKHEKTHIKRRDYLIKPIAFLALTLHWFNPVIWISYFLMIKDMEMSCDEAVIKESSEDIRESYSNSMLALAVKQSNLFMPLAFGESNIKTRIKNILNYKKPRFWIIGAALVVLSVFATGLLSNPLDINEPKPDSEARAEEFLEVYYTIENTDIADLIMDQSLYDSIISSDYNTSEQGIVMLRGIDDALKSKYGSLMTENGLDVAASNRVIPQGEMAARKYGSTMEVNNVNIVDMRISDYGSISYTYTVEGLVKFNDGKEELVTLRGSLLIREVDGIWKVDRFNPEGNELEKVLQYGQSNLILTYESDFSTIRSIEVVRKDKLQHITCYVNGSLEGTKNEYVNQMGYIPFDGNIDFTIKVLDKNNIVLAEQEFTKDFSNGKDVELFVREEENGSPIISESSIPPKEFTLNITSEITNISNEEFKSVGTTGIDNPTKNDFRKFTFQVYMEHGNDIKNRTITIPDYYKIFKVKDHDIYWTGGNGSQDNASENFAQYTYDILLFTRGYSDADLVEVLNSEDIIIAFTQDGNFSEQRYKVGNVTKFE